MAIRAGRFQRPSIILTTRSEQNVPVLAPAPVTLERAGAFFALLCDLGCDTAFDQLSERVQAAKAIPVGRKATLAEATGETQAQKASVAAVEDESIHLNMGEVFRQIGRHDAYPRLASIIFQVDEQEAGALSVEAVRDAFIPFGVESASLFKEVLFFATDLA